MWTPDFKNSLRVDLRASARVETLPNACQGYFKEGGREIKSSYVGVSQSWLCPPDGGWTLNTTTKQCTRTKPVCDPGPASDYTFYEGWYNTTTKEYKGATNLGFATVCDGKCERTIAWDRFQNSSSFNHDAGAVGWTRAYSSFPNDYTGKVCSLKTTPQNDGQKPPDAPPDTGDGDGEDPENPSKCKADEVASYSGGKLVCTPKPKPPASEPGSGEGEGGDPDGQPQGNCPNGYHQSTQNGRNVCVINQSPNPGSGSSGAASGPSSGASDAGTGTCKGSPDQPCNVKVDESGTPSDGGEAMDTTALGEAMNQQHEGLQKIGAEKPDTGWSFTPGWLQSGSCSPYVMGTIKGQTLSIDYCPAAEIGRAIMAFIWGVAGVFLCARLVFKTFTGG